MGRRERRKGGEGRGSEGRGEKWKVGEGRGLATLSPPEILPTMKLNKDCLTEPSQIPDLSNIAIHNCLISRLKF